MIVSPPEPEIRMPSLKWVIERPSTVLPPPVEDQAVGAAGAGAVDLDLDDRVVAGRQRVGVGPAWL